MDRLSQDLTRFSVDELLADDEHLNELAKVLEARGQIMLEINALDGEIEELEKDLGAAERRHLEITRKSLREAGNSIRQKEQKIENALKDGLAQLRGQSRKLREGRHSNRAYGSRGDAGEGLFVDKRR